MQSGRSKPTAPVHTTSPTKRRGDDMSEPKTAPPAANPEQPRPMPFAIMRNAHEALRASIRLQEQSLAAGDTAAFREEWQRFQRALAVHMAMEDDSMFELLDSVSA